MNKSVLGFLAGIVLIAVTVLGFLIITQQDEAAETAPPVRATQPVPQADPTAVPQRIETPATPAPPPPGVELAMSRALGGDGTYAPGGTVDVTITLSAEGSGEPVRAMGIEEFLPAGFVFDGVVSDRRPDLAPPAGRTDKVEFAWFNIPEFPFSFTYRLRAGENAAGTAEIRGETLYRTSGPEHRTGIEVTPLHQTGAAPTPAPAAQAPAAEEAPAAPGIEAQAVPIPAPAPPAAPPSVPQSASQPATGQLSMGRSAGAYTPGQSLEIAVELGFEGDAALTTLAILDTVPSGWAFEGAGGDAAPDIVPQDGKDGNLAFVWMRPPTLPASFTYTVRVPDDADGSQRISGTGVWSTGGLERHTEPVITDVSPQ